MEKRKYPIGPEHYELFEEVGQGVSASVHRALCKAFDDIVAIKILDFERENSDLSSISREAQTMVLIDHPNVLKSHCSFVSDHNLWVVMPYMSGGSCLHILKAAHPDGFEEMIIATVLREILKGLEYLHHHGHIHRDVKAGNILIDSRGAIKLGDFGVSACLFDSGDRQRTRNTFVGTPCWMAPEVMEQLHGYDFKADIWSFGITALELAHGHAPFSKFPPMKVLLMTLQNAPPGLDYERDKKFSKSFKQMIASCLVKDPSKRPSAKKLLKHSFFKQARSNDYVRRTLLDGLPDLGDRIEILKRKEEDMLAQKEMPDGQKEEISQNEYKRGISGWNFNIEDMKYQASLIQDDFIADGNQGGSSNSHLVQVPEIPDMEDSNIGQNQPTSIPLVDSAVNYTKVGYEKSDDDISTASSCNDLNFSRSCSPRQGDLIETSLGEKIDLEIGKSMDVISIHSHPKMGGSSGTVSPDVTVVIKAESDKVQNQSQTNGATTPLGTDDAHLDIPPKPSKSSAASSEELDEKTKVPVVQQRGRFKVTSENVELDKVVPTPILQKSHSMQVITQHPLISLPPPLHPPIASETASSPLSSSSLFPLLHSVLQTNISQRESILNLMKRVSAADTTANKAADGPIQTDKSSLDAAHEREKDLLNEVTELQWRLICAQDELQKVKTEHAQV